MLAELWPGLRAAHLRAALRHPADRRQARRRAGQLRQRPGVRRLAGRHPRRGGLRGALPQGLGSSTVATRLLRDLDANSVYLTYDGAEDRAALQLASTRPAPTTARPGWAATTPRTCSTTARRRPRRPVRARGLKHFSVADNAGPCPTWPTAPAGAAEGPLELPPARGHPRHQGLRAGGERGRDAQYHHGSASLEQTIAGMAQDYPGPTTGAAAPRGPVRHPGEPQGRRPALHFSRLDARTAALFRAEDDPVLRHLSDEGRASSSASGRSCPPCCSTAPPASAPATAPPCRRWTPRRWSTTWPPGCGAGPGAAAALVEGPPGGRGEAPEAHGPGASPARRHRGGHRSRRALQRLVPGAPAAAPSSGTSGRQAEQTFVRTFEQHRGAPHFVLACDRALLEPLDDEAVARAPS